MVKNMSDTDRKEYEKALLHAEKGHEYITDADLACLLETPAEEAAQLFELAAKKRQENFGDKVFLYGFVYFSTYCRNNCSFCYYRQENHEPPRYRKSRGEILSIARSLRDSGVHLLDLTMGEDPFYLNNGETGFNQLKELIAEIKAATKLPLMISPGVIPPSVLDELQMAGGDWYALYQETHNKELYEKLRLKQPYIERWEKKEYARNHGWLVEEGLLVGLGETVSDLVRSLRIMEKLGAMQVRTMTFVPQKGTPLGDVPAISNQRELNLIAVMRLLMPERLIPASLDVEGVSGLKARLRAGANVVTSIIPPESGLAGVSNATLDVAEGYRTVAGVTPILKECGLRPAAGKEYEELLRYYRGGEKK